jgi:hypothetical protein
MGQPFIDLTWYSLDVVDLLLYATTVLNYFVAYHRVMKCNLERPLGAVSQITQHGVTHTPV